MQSLIEDFLFYLRHERGQADHTQRTYAALLNKFVNWADNQGIRDWKTVELTHLMAFLQHERERQLGNQPEESSRRLSSESLYLEIAALRAFYRFAENEKLLPANFAENLSLPRRWKRLPKALSSQEMAYRRYVMPTVGLEDVDQVTRDKTIKELYPKFAEELKANIIEYGRTLKSLKDEEVLVFQVKLTRCAGCGIPSSLEYTIKGSALKDFNAGKIDKNLALNKISVKKGQEQ